jgi:hypothetical protein
MGKSTGHILKANNVKLEGRFHLDLVPAGLSPPKRKNAASSTPKVRIVENHPEFAVVEITCPCGTKTHLKCQYASAEVSGNQAPNQTK